MVYCYHKDTYGSKLEKARKKTMTEFKVGDRVKVEFEGLIKYATDPDTGEEFYDVRPDNTLSDAKNIPCDYLIKIVEPPKHGEVWKDADGEFYQWCDNEVAWLRFGFEGSMEPVGEFIRVLDSEGNPV